MRTKGHLLISSGLGTVYGAATGEPLAGVAVLGVGTLMDLDHTLDWYNWLYRGDRDHVLYLLHSWEYLLLALVLVTFPWNLVLIGGILVGFISHLLTDQVTNLTRPLTYFLTYRAKMRFRIALVFAGHTVPESLDTAKKQFGDLPFLGRTIADFFDRHMGLGPSETTGGRAGRVDR